MFVQLEVGSPLALRALAKFANELADIQGTQPASIIESPVVEELPVPEQEKPKRTRQTKEKAVVLEEPAPKAKEESPDPEPVTESATTAETPAESSSQETATPVTHDTLRAIYGALVSANKRDAAVNVIKGAGYSSIKEIPVEKLDVIHEQLKAI